nr:MAG TPA: hypothetical protein [Caudoviricetes sp.]
MIYDSKKLYFIVQMNQSCFSHYVTLVIYRLLISLT